MTFQRIFGAQADLTGRTVGTLYVEDVVSINPVLRYSAKCMACGAITAYSHVELMQGSSCKNASCLMQRERQELERRDRELRRAVRASRGW